MDKSLRLCKKCGAVFHVAVGVRGRPWQHCEKCRVVRKRAPSVPLAPMEGHCAASPAE